MPIVARMMSGLIVDNPFWKFSVAIYSTADVAAECLALQDRHGVNVNVLLFAAWLGLARKRVLSPHDVTSAEAAIQSWHDGVVAPLLAARRFIAKSDTELQRLRDEIQRTEIEAEQIEQALLFAFAERQWPGEGSAPPAAAVRLNLATALDAKGYSAGDVEGSPFERLCAAALAGSKS